MTEREDESAWFHGSQQPLTTLQVGSSITHDRDVARIFSHRPSLVSHAGPRGLKHNGTTSGYLYRVVEAVSAEDVYPHPHPVNRDRWEWLTRRELRVEQLEVTQVRAAERLSEDELAALRELQRTMGTDSFVLEQPET